MIEQSVFLQTEQDAVDFTAKVSKYFGDIRMDLGSFAIDAKSIASRVSSITLIPRLFTVS